MVTIMPITFRNLALLLLVYWTVGYTLITVMAQESTQEELKQLYLRQLDSLSGATFGEERENAERSLNNQSEDIPLYNPDGNRRINQMDPLFRQLFRAFFATVENDRPSTPTNSGSRYEQALRRKDVLRSLDSLSGATFGRQRKRYDAIQRMSFDRNRKGLDSLSGTTFGQQKEN